MTTHDRGVTGWLWDFFCSLKLSISLLILLATTSVIGTLVQQNQPYEEYLKEYSPSTIKLFNSLGFFDMYHSWWFLLLLYLLTVNIIACSIKRLPRVWKMVSEPTLILDSGLEKSLSLCHDLKISGDAASLRDRMAAILKAEFAEPVITEHEGEFHLFAQKSPYSRLGVYVVHASIIIIFVGAMIGSFFGYKAFVNIVEGTGTQTVYSRQGDPIDLGFQVRCEKFSVSFYDTGAPKEFKSILTVTDNGRIVVDRQPIVVNDPLTYKGITFYQSSYGPAGDALFRLSVRQRSGGESRTINLRSSERASLPGGGTVRVLEHTADIQPYIPQFSGPAAKLELVSADGKAEQFILVQNYPDFDRQRGGSQIFTYDGVEEKYYTGLQVAKDPGVWIVWAGCSLMIIGLCMAFFMSHRRIWIRTVNGRITIAGTTNKNQPAFQMFYDGLLAKLKKV